MASDRELVQAFQSGDRQAGEMLVDRHYGRVLGFFRNKAPAAANDLAQRTFLGFFEAIDRLQDGGNLRSFLFAIACNQLRKHYRESRRDGDKLDFGTVSAMDLDPSPSRVVAERQEQRILLEALRRIPLDHQIVLELFYWEDMTASEIALAVDAPLGTVKTRIRRGRQLLEQVLMELDGPAAVLEGTKSDLEGWARSLREQALGVS